MRLLAALPFLIAVAGAMAQSPSPADSSCSNCGVIVSIQMSEEDEQWEPLGVVSPRGSITSPGEMQARSAFALGPEGNRGLVLIGSAGGAVYAKRSNSYRKPRWDVTVKMDAGNTRVLPQRYEPLLREGDRVRVFGTQLELI
jgi:hypothetical protein